jgi:DNA recombination protein RmuC
VDDWLLAGFGVAGLAALLTLALVIVLLLRKPPAPDSGREELLAANERLERELRREIAESSRGLRQEVSQQLTLLQKTLNDTLSTQLALLQQSNAGKLDEMRRTVDERLQTTLEARLGESFRQVAQRLEQVQQGLGQMQVLAQGVGDLQRVLTNVKARGIFGEVQLQALLEQVLTPEQFARQVETRPTSNQRVDFAVRLPGRGDGAPVWLPIDAKFPREDYERLLDARERADAVAAESAGRALEVRIRQEAKSICESYLAPPHTTDFAILFLPI